MYALQAMLDGKEITKTYQSMAMSTNWNNRKTKGTKSRKSKSSNLSEMNLQEQPYFRSL
jgi:hypothetical protein